MKNIENFDNENINIPELVRKKVVISGNIVEVYEYEVGYWKGYVKEPSENEKLGRKKGFRSENYDKHREQVLSRARRDLRRIINANIGSYGRDFTAKFVTLTFADNVQSVQDANYEFQKFIKRLNYQMFGNKKANIKYSTVIEFQKRGAVHYHVIFYNLPYLKADMISNVWGNGFIKINKIDNVDNVGAYVCKYMTKDNVDERLEGQKSYFSSRGLYKPMEITEEKQVETLAGALPESVINFESVFKSEHLGDIKYKQYNLNLLPHDIL